ncbi:MAG TPA: c-type cytochrome [Candidatus Acidoferrum sp.]|jgi:mono/diheme cytochrome c family protein
MKSQIAFLTIAAGFLTASITLAQRNISSDAGAAPAANNTRTHESVLTKAPEKYRAKPNPLATDPTAAAAGKILFEQHCVECHGQAAEGSHWGPSLRREEVQNAQPGAIFWLVTNGVVRHGMPVWSKLPEPQRWQIISYIKSLGLPAVMPDGKAELSPAPNPQPATAVSPRR